MSSPGPTQADLVKATIEALTDLALADGLRDVRNVQGDLLAILGVPDGVIVDCTSVSEIESVLSQHGYADQVAWSP